MQVSRHLLRETSKEAFCNMALRVAGFLTVMIATAAGFMPLPAPASVLASVSSQNVL